MVDFLKHRERVRKRFVQTGINPFEDYEALELLLFHTISRADTKPIAKALLKEFGSLSGVLDADYEDLLKVDGVGPRSAFLLSYIPQLSRKYFENKSTDYDVIRSGADAGYFLLDRYVGYTKETVGLICLDNKSRVKNFSIIREGSVNSTDISLRKILEVSIKHNAAAVVLAHNHPNGCALPSNSDIETTKIIKNTLASMAITLVDHIIIADGDFVSLNDSYYSGKIHCTEE